MKELPEEDSQSELLKHQGNDINATATKHRDYSSIIDDKAIVKRKRVKWGIIGALILVAVILAIVLPITLSKKDDNNSNNPDDPIPVPPPVPPPTPPPVPPPVRQHYNPYTLDKATFIDNQSRKSGVIQAPAQYNQEFHMQALNDIIPVLKNGTKKLGIDSEKIPQGENNKFANNIEFQFDMQTWRVAHLVLSDKDSKRYSIPEMAVLKPKVDDTMRLEMLGLELNEAPFSLKFRDPTDPTNVFLSTEGQSLVVMDKFIQMDFELPSQRVYGFGERIHDFQLDEGTWTMWAIGLDSPIDDGTGRKGVYGVHPFILVQTQKKGDYIGMFFRNSNAQSPVLKYNDDGKSTLSYITLGGQIDVYFFIHGSAKEIIAQYQSMFGKPNLPPFWSLGWQQASWKYVNQSMVEEVIDQYALNNMPLETIYLDIPYMNKFQDFTVDTVNFNNLQALAKRLHDAGQRLVVIIDAAISADDVTEANKYYTMGNSDDVFIKSSLYQSKKYNGNLISKVWPDTAVFVDWFNDKCMNVWAQGLYDLHNLVPFDGIWIDMNEPTTFIHGEKVPEDIILPTKPQFLGASDDDNNDYTWYYEFKNQDKESTFDLPFIPGYQPTEGNPEAYSGNFDYMTLSLNSTLPSINEKAYNVHSLYGHMMAKRTFEYMNGANSPKPDDRPFILTRSSFASTGRYASHWLGDNWRSWEYMKLSIAGIMNMNMFGIPQAGADVCGFFGKERDDEMCGRWIQLATFYPLARAHQNQTFKLEENERSEPYTLQGKYKDWARYSIRDRLHYLRHMYTCFYEVSQNGGSCIDPLFYYYPDDDNTYTDTSSTFMVGGAIKVSPVLESLADGAKTFKSYFPKGDWVSLNNYAAIVQSIGEMKDLPADQATVQAHLRPGSLISYQQLINSEGAQIKVTNELINQPIQIIVNRDLNGHAQGSLFLDEGISRGEIESKSYEYYQINHQTKSFQFQFTEGTRGAQDNYLDQLIIANAEDLKYTSFACYMDTQKQMHDLVPKYNEVTKAVYFTSATQVKFNQILNVYYGSDKQKDVNLCSPLTFQYKVANNGKLPDLNANNVAVELEHVAATLPNIEVKFRVIETDIVNVRWSWKLDKDGKVPAGMRIPAEVPHDIIDTDKPDAQTKLYSFLTVQDSPFQITFKYRSSANPSNVLTIQGMLFDSYLNWINVQAHTSSGDQFSGIFGLGERATKDFFLKDGVYSMWSRDQPTPDETGTLPGSNMYGTHPYFMYKHKQNAWVGVLYKLAHAQDWWVKNDKDLGTVDLSTIATGGVVDIYVIQSQHPDDVVNKYFRLIGRPVMVPQWALGWNQCKWGYKTVEDLKDVVANYDKYSIPLDVQWSDIDYLNKYRTFEYDKTRFADLPAFVKDLKTNNRRYIPILDAGIAYRPEDKTYLAFQEALEQGLFTTIDGKPFIGQVWPNDAAYPDYTNPATNAWFKKHLSLLHDEIEFDGLWEDMNEASNFCKGACYRNQVVDKPVKNNLRYTPTGRDLEIKSMSLDTTHSNGLLQLDTHNYYGTQMAKATHEWFNDQKQRTFIIERSSFAGMGKFASRWLGDNFSEERFMGYSVSGTMLMNIFGITMAGSDICGFIGDTNAELCARWHHVGAYYPFSRNHNNWGQLPQEPWAFGDSEYEPGMKYIDIMRNAIKLKYSLIRYYYTNLFMVSYYNQGTFYKPVFFEFPEDMNTHINITQNVMIGSALKVSFNSEYTKQNITQFYFPEGIWCDIVRKTQCMESTGQFYNMSTKVYETYLHLRQGYIIPYQDTSELTLKTSADLQEMPIELHILGEPSTNDGYLYWSSQGTYVNDNGVELDVNGNFNGYNFAARQDDTLQIRILPTYIATNYMDKIEKGCAAVNQNDYLLKIYIYYAKTFQVNQTYKVTATSYNSPDVEDLGEAIYNPVTDRLEIQFKSAICMTRIQTIDFTKIV